MSRTQALLLHNTKVVTLDRNRPRAQALLVVDGRIAAVGGEEYVRAHPAAAGAKTIDCAGRTLAPAFIDAHIHLLAAAARLDAVDCGPGAVTSIEQIKARIRERAAGTPPGAWVRAAGYDELALAEGRHPDRRDLDAAAPDHPVRLVHRTGHACVLNSRALAIAGIDASTPEPPGAYMERDLATGEPTGILIEMNDVLDGVVPPLPYRRLAAAVAALDRELLSAGVAWVEDAGAANGLEEWRLFQRLKRDGCLSVGLSVMEGIAGLGSLPHDAGDGSLRRAGVKVQPRELEHELWPAADEIARQVRRADAAGRQAAIHAVGRRAIEAALDAFEALGPERCRARRHRIEHAGLCSPAAAARLARLGVTVVTQPGFLYWSGGLMKARLPEADVDDLYPLRRLLDAGVSVAGSSDAPAAPAAPIAAMRAAVERRARDGARLAPEQGLSGEEALALFTCNAARALGLEAERGTLRPGLAADCVLLSKDPTAAGVPWNAVRVEMTLIAGRVVHDSRAGAAHTTLQLSR